MADTRDLKSLAKYLAYGFESRLRHFVLFDSHTDYSMRGKGDRK